MTTLTLLEDACGRVCHDLSTPLAGMMAALDYLGADAAGEAAAVLREGAAALQARLRLWRTVAGGGGEPMDGPMLAALLDGAWSGGRVLAEASGLAAVVPVAMARAVLLGAMIAAEALPRGGEVRIAGDARQAAILPDGRGAAWPASLTASLSGQDVGGSRHVLPTLLVALTGATGIRPALALGAGSAPGPLILSAT
ncbi:histidine phosphotransferase family protein [Roseomonas sp. CCTCC AB2023176]|uniref:histidine phosphotransferase family protein n=1 Tax=Roseomonas sp. CCTCC AB2023176 TaxID=3342640 RepID=UPI0035E130D9